MKPGSTSKGKTVINSGSPQPGEPVYLTIGRVRRPHGVKGEILSELVTEHPENIVAGKKVLIGDSLIPCVISRIRQADKLWLVSFEGYDDCQMVEGFRNQQIYIYFKDAAPLPEGSFYHHEIIGMRVFDENEELLGMVSEIVVTGANDVYVVSQDSGAEILIPAIKSVIMKMDRESRSMVVRQQEWL